MNKHRLLALMLFLTLPLPASTGAQQPATDTAVASKIQLPEATATRWLPLIDSSRYGANWDSTATMFRGQIGELLRSHRNPR